MMKMRNPVQVQDDEKDEDKDLEDLQSPTTKKAGRDIPPGFSPVPERTSIFTSVVGCTTP
jgi:hypothetical protein